MGPKGSTFLAHETRKDAFGKRANITITLLSAVHYYRLRESYRCEGFLYRYSLDTIIITNKYNDLTQS